MAETEDRGTEADPEPQATADAGDDADLPPIAAPTDGPSAGDADAENALGPDSTETEGKGSDEGGTAVEPSEASPPEPAAGTPPEGDAPEAAPMEDEEDDAPAGPTLRVSVDDDGEGRTEGDAAAENENDADADDVEMDDRAGPTLQFTFQQNPEDHDNENENENENDHAPPEDHQDENEPVGVPVPPAAPLEASASDPTPPSKKRARSEASPEDKEEEYRLLHSTVVYEEKDPQTLADQKTVANTKPESHLELALTNLLRGKEVHIHKLMNEITKLKGFISKRKQTYKRKRKDESAPTRALSAYNIFVQDQFEKLAKKNDAALQSTDTNAQLERVPPANLVAKTGGLWKNLPEEEKEKYRERAKRDRKRYEEQMGKYQPPDKQANRKRNKTGYNMFFSAHVTRLKQSETGVPSERGSVARLVGTAWKQLSSEEKQYYEREADKHNGMNPVDKGDDDRDGSGDKAQGSKANPSPSETDPGAAAQQQAAASLQDPYGAHPYGAHDLSAGYAHAMQQHVAASQPPPQPHDPRAMAAAAAAHHGYYYAAHAHGHGQPPPPPPHAHAHAHAQAYHYDYAGHHAAAAAQQQAAAAAAAAGGGPPPHGRGGSRQPYPPYGQHPASQGHGGYYDK